MKTLKTLHINDTLISMNIPEVPGTYPLNKKLTVLWSSLYTQFGLIQIILAEEIMFYSPREEIN
jgi:hypothetical protein